MKELRNKAVGAAGNGGVAENAGVHPKGWVVRLVERRGLVVGDKTLYGWSAHLERFLRFCRDLGAESSEIPEVAVRLFLESLPVGSSAQEFAREQARMALDVFLSEMEGWAWGEDRFGRRGPKFRLKATRTGLTTTGKAGALEEEQPEVGPKGAKRAGASESKETESREGLVSTKQEVILNEGKVIGQNRKSWEAMQRAMRVRHYALRTEESYLHWVGRFLNWLEGTGVALEDLWNVAWASRFPRCRLQAGGLRA